MLAQTKRGDLEDRSVQSVRCSISTSNLCRESLVETHDRLILLKIHIVALQLFSYYAYEYIRCTIITL